MFTDAALARMRAEADQSLAELAATHDRYAWGRFLAQGFWHLANCDAARERAEEVPGGLPAIDRLYGYALETLGRAIATMREQHREGKLT